MHSHAKQLFRLFKGLDRAYGRYTLSGVKSSKGKAEGSARTELGIPAEDHWLAHLDGKQGLGIIPIQSDSRCVFGAVDIDVYKDFDINALEHKLSESEIPAIVCRTKSGGAHVYVFTKESVPAKLMRGKLIELADMLGFGDAEVFPKQIQLASEKDIGSWINMPYFDSKNTNRYAILNGKALKIQEFISLIKALQVTEAALGTLNFTSVVSEKLEDAPPCLVKLCAQGFPEGTRNAGLFNLGVYCRLRHGDNWESWVDEMNQDFMQPALPSKEVRNIIKQLDKKKYYYQCPQPPLVSACNQRACRLKKFGVGGGEDIPPYELGTLVKIDSLPPTWFIDVNGVRLELTTEDLVNQQRFRRLCVECINKLPPTMKTVSYEKMIADRLENVEIVEAPEDAGARGQFLFHLQQFLSSKTGRARTQSQLTMGKRWHENERVYFRSADLMSYLEKHRFRDFKPRQIWPILRQEGAEHKQIHTKGKCVQCWHIPEPNEQLEDHDVPSTMDVPGEKDKEF